jgi:thiol-disulfide isomerase/thioredoxin
MRSWVSRGMAVAVLLGGTALLPAAGPATRPALPPLEDRPAPDFAGRDLEGKLLKLSELRGKVVLLNFWGTWCPPCREELPELVALHHDLHGRGFEIVSIDVGDEKERVPGFVAEHHLPYRVLTEERVADLYRVTAFPTNLVIDPRGHIRFVAEGYSEEAIPDIRRVVEHLLEDIQ